MSDNISQEKQFQAWLKSRNKTVRLLKELADKCDKMKRTVDKASIASTSGSIVAGICVLSAPFTSGLTARVVANVCKTATLASTAISVGSCIGECLFEKHFLQEVQNALDKDRRKTIKMLEHVSKIVQVTYDIGQANGVTDVPSKTHKIVMTAAKVMQCAFDIENLHDAITKVSLVVDIVHLIETVYKVSKGSMHAVSTQIRNIASELERKRDIFHKDYKRQQQFEERQRQLEESQQQLEESQRQLEKLQRQLHERQRQLEKRQRQSESQPQVEKSQLEESQRQFGEIQSELVESQSLFGESQSLLGESQLLLGESQSELGKSQSQLGGESATV